MNGVAVGIGDVSENPSDELNRVEDLGRASVVSWFGLVEGTVKNELMFSISTPPRFSSPSI